MELLGAAIVTRLSLSVHLQWAREHQTLFDQGRQRPSPHQGGRSVEASSRIRGSERHLHQQLRSKFTSGTDRGRTGQAVKMKMVVADMSKGLASVSTVCDRGNRDVSDEAGKGRYVYDDQGLMQ